MIRPQTQTVDIFNSKLGLIIYRLMNGGYRDIIAY